MFTDAGGLHFECSLSSTPISHSGFAAARDATYKLIQLVQLHGPALEELYDLAIDPLETNNLLPGPLNSAQQAAYSALQAAIGQLQSTAPSVVSYGTAGCAGSNGSPAISAVGQPRLGQTYTVGLQNGARSRSAVLLLGYSNAEWQGFTLPFPLASIGGASGCFVWAAGHLHLVTTTNSQGAAWVPVALPDNSTLLAARLYHSWLVTDPLAPGNPLGLTSSDGLRATVGQ